jgi:predicted metal-dependent hydrolase
MITVTSFEQSLLYDNTAINYKIIRSTRRKKTSEIIVKKDGKVIVRTPFDKGISEIDELIQKNAKWILQKHSEYKKATTSSPQIVEPTFEEGSTLPYLGKNYPFRIINHQGKKGNNRIEFVNEEEQFLVYLDNFKSSKIRIKSLYEEWLRQKAYLLFEEKVKHYSTLLAVEEPSQIKIKNLKSRWGSATKDNVINLDMNLLKASEDVIDYVALHELCHLKVKDHSHHFWDLLYRFMPNYHEKINWLKANGSSLMH